MTALELADSEFGEGEQELLGFLVRDAERSKCCQVGAYVRATVADYDRVDGGRNLAFLQVSLLIGSARLVPDFRVTSSLAQSHFPARVAQRYQQRYVPRVLLVDAFRQVVVVRAANLHQHNLDALLLGQRGRRRTLAPADEERKSTLSGKSRLPKVPGSIQFGMVWSSAPLAAKATPALMRSVQRARSPSETASAIVWTTLLAAEVIRSLQRSTLNVRGVCARSPRLHPLKWRHLAGMRATGQKQRQQPRLQQQWRRWRPTECP